MTTARSIIEQSLKKISVLGRGETLSDSEAQDALKSLNNMLESWSVEGGMVYTQTRESFPLTGASSYTIGTGGDFSTVRPFEIEALYTSSGGTDYKANQVDQRSYANIAYKTSTGIPEVFFYDNNSPLGNLFLYPVGDATYTLNIYSRKPLTEFTGLTTDVTLPAGYERGLVLNLAVEMATDYEREPTPTLLRVAGESKANIFTYNARNDARVSHVDGALVNNDSFNIYSGEY